MAGEGDYWVDLAGVGGWDVECEQYELEDGGDL